MPTSAHELMITATVLGLAGRLRSFELVAASAVSLCVPPADDEERAAMRAPARARKMPDSMNWNGQNR